MLTPVKLVGNYLCNHAGRFIPVGVNWVPARAAMQWPFEWEPAHIEADFTLMKAMSINLARFDLVWQWVEPRPGQYNPKAFEQFDFLIQLAHKYEVYLNPALFAGGEVGDAWWEVPWRQGRHPHADADMLFWQARHVEQFARRYRGESAILAWDLTDEPPFWVVMKPEQTTDAMAAVWTQLLTESIHKYDPEHLVMVGASNMELSRGPFRADVISPWVDLLSVHPYPLYNQSYYPEPILSTRSSYSPSFETALVKSIGKPVLMQEFGSTSAQCGLEVQARYFRIFMHSALAAGNMGLVAWTFTDADPKIQYQRAPYKRNPHETQFGVTEANGALRPQGRELQKMGAILRSLDLSDLEPEPAQAGILAPHEWAQGIDYREYGFPADTLYQYVPRDDILHHSTNAAAQEQLTQTWLSAYILGRQAGMPVSFPRENDNWQDLKLILVPYPLTGSSGVYFSYHLYTTFWQKASRYLSDGGTLYASLNANSAIPRELCREIGGFTLEDRAGWKSEIQITFTQPFGNIQAGSAMQFAAFPGVDGSGVIVANESAQVIALDQDGHPAILAHDYGKGRLIVATYPIELLLGKTYAAFETPRIETDFYRALGQVAGLQPVCQVNRSEIECGVLQGKGRSVVILANHSAQTQTGQALFHLPITSLQGVTENGKRPIPYQERSWSFTLDAFSGALYETQHG